ncbi:hypothetical protein ACM66B_006252 [Microbotryomycetes sp. NB124-2]
MVSPARAAAPPTPPPPVGKQHGTQPRWKRLHARRTSTKAVLAVLCVTAIIASALMSVQSFNEAPTETSPERDARRLRERSALHVEDASVDRDQDAHMLPANPVAFPYAAIGVAGGGDAQEPQRMPVATAFAIEKRATTTTTRRTTTTTKAATATSRYCTSTSQCAGLTIPANSHHYCNYAQRRCTWLCNSGYTLRNGACVKNAGTSSKTTTKSERLATTPSQRTYQ